MAVLNANTVSDGGTNITARVWINFKGTVPTSQRGSYNVTSLSRNALGDYTLNYSITLPDTNYCVQITGGGGDGQGANFGIGIYGTNAASSDNQTYLTTTNVRMLQANGNGIDADSDSIHVLIFR